MQYVINLKFTNVNIINNNGKYCRSAGVDGCDAKATGIATSFTLYAIGETKATGGENPMVWFRIYPRKEDNSGWWYYKGNKNTHSKLLIHPKEKSSKSNEGFVVNDNICWAKLHEMIRSSKSIDTIKAQKFAKSLFGSPFEKVKTIGTLKVVQ